MADLHITRLKDAGDERGHSFSVPQTWVHYLGSPVDLHVTTLRPGFVRGNHYHVDRREVLIVVHADRWSLHWDRGPLTKVEERTFHGTGAVLLEVDPLAAHAVVNSGTVDLQIIGITNQEFDLQEPDSFSRLVAKVIILEDGENHNGRIIPDVLSCQ